MSAALRVTALLAGCGALLGYSASLVIPHSYKGHAVLVFSQRDSAGLLDRARQATLDAPSLDAIIRHSDSFRLRIYTDSMPDLIDDLRRHVTIAPTGASGATVDFEDDDRDAALEIDSALVAALTDNTVKAAGKDPTRIVQTPELEFAGWTPAWLTTIGLGGGLVLGFAVTFFAPRSR